MAETVKAGRLSRMFDTGLPVRPPLSDEELAAIPAKRGVFLLAGDAGEPILLATAADIRARVRHRLAASDQPAGPRADLRKIAGAVFWKLSTSHFETDWHYLRIVRKVYPDTYRAMLAFGPAWFVHMDAQEQFPGFRRSRDVLEQAGDYLGPFPDKHAAQRFVDALVDAFDLCRCEHILRRQGDPSSCVYAQMGRCRAYCQGGASMAEYRRLLAEALAFAAGDRSAARGRIEEQMRRLAADKEYERAAAIKSRLERLAVLEADAFSHVADARRLQHILVQPGVGPHQAKVFLADRGAIRAGPALAFPLVEAQVRQVLERMRSWSARDRRVSVNEREGIALVAHYLFGAAERRGLIVPCRPDLTAEELAGRTEEAAGALKLRRPARRAKEAGGAILRRENRPRRKV